MIIRQGYKGNVWYRVYERYMSERDGTLVVEEVCVIYVEHVKDEWVMAIGDDKGIARKWFKICDNVRLEFVIYGGMWEYYRDTWKCSW